MWIGYIYIIIVLKIPRSVFVMSKFKYCHNLWLPQNIVIRFKNNFNWKRVLIFSVFCQIPSLTYSNVLLAQRLFARDHIRTGSLALWFRVNFSCREHWQKIRRWEKRMVREFIPFFSLWAVVGLNFLWRLWLLSSRQSLIVITLGSSPELFSLLGSSGLRLVTDGMLSSTSWLPVTTLLTVSFTKLTSTTLCERASQGLKIGGKDINNYFVRQLLHNFHWRLSERFIFKKGLCLPKFSFVKGLDICFSHYKLSLQGHNSQLHLLGPLILDSGNWFNMDHDCYGLDCVFLKLMFSVQYDDIWMWGLWEVSRSWVQALMNGFNTLIKDTPENFLAIWGHNKKTIICKPISGFSLDVESDSTLIWDFQLL